MANSCFVENLLAFGNISFLSPTLHLPSFDIRMLDIQAFHYHKTHKTTRFMSLYASVYVLRTAYNRREWWTAYVTLTHSLALVFVSSP